MRRQEMLDRSVDALNRMRDIEERPFNGGPGSNVETRSRQALAAAMEAFSWAVIAHMAADDQPPIRVRDEA